jgi:mannose-P-dolichol utilization defect protein 1
VPRAAVAALYDANNLVLLAARVPQIAKNHANKSTGQLSGITFGVNTAGCVARIFTTLHEGGGAAMLRSYALSEQSVVC